MKKLFIVALTATMVTTGLVIPAKATTKTNIEESMGKLSFSQSYTQSAYIRTLSIGSSGSDVRVLQDCLIYIGYSLESDGYFGPRTESAVKSFQRSHGLTPDGIVGPLTWDAINKAVGGIH
ncbi:peptidoglycan-binding domain-containing protein [Clostridium sp. Marseille-QA1073]